MKIDGLEVVDPRRRITIHVTKQDNARAKKKDPSACAAALACVRDIKGCTEARVHLGRTYVKIGKQYLRFKTPQPVRAELISFDRGSGFQPGEYTLVPMGPSGALGAGRGSNKNRNQLRVNKKPRAVQHVVIGVRHQAPRGGRQKRA